MYVAIIVKINKNILITVALGCEILPSPTNGGVSVQIGPNSLTNGLGSVATYYCDRGYALVGEVNRTCEDTNGGTVTTGTWTKKPPICQGTGTLLLS